MQNWRNASERHIAAPHFPRSCLLGRQVASLQKCLLTPGTVHYRMMCAAHGHVSSMFSPALPQHASRRGPQAL